jgi:hypothetical protein
MITATERAERIRDRISRNGSSNSSSVYVNAEAVMAEWHEAVREIRSALSDQRKPWDKRRPAEDELNNILFVIETAFPFDWGSTPNDLQCRLCESGDKRHTESCEKAMLWNYPEFAKIVSGRAKSSGITTRVFISKSLSPLKMRDFKGNIRQAVLEQLFGREYCMSKLRNFANAPEDHRTRIKENKKIRQGELREEEKFREKAGRKNI